MVSGPCCQPGTPRMSTEAARAVPPRLPGHSPCERNHLPWMLTGVINGAGGFFAEPYLPALSSLGTRSRGPCLPALCLPFTPHRPTPPAGEGGRSKARLGCQPPDLLFPSPPLPAARTNPGLPRTMTSFPTLALISQRPVLC